jgi:uncharacterized damage-inducible protein DinB/predicted RNase H-like HicB family nuclease
MRSYALYLESGPRRQRTMVHVTDLLGCIAKGPTTEAALAATPAAIRAYLRFVQRHGESVHPNSDFRIEIIEHLTVGQWLGNGDPALAFTIDRAPLRHDDAEHYIRRLEWSRADILILLEGLSDEQLAEAPPSGDRPILAMLEHLLDSEHFYLATLGPIPGTPGAGHVAQKREGPIREWMAYLRAREIEHIRALSADERAKTVERWKQTWTARKALRRMLEHEWEHLCELGDRLGQPL